MFCSNCGSNIPDGSTMCPNCGAAQQPQYNDPYGQQNNYNQNYSQPYQASAPAPAKNNNTLLIVGIIVAVVAAIAIIVAIVLTKKDDKDKDSASADGTYVCDLGGGAEMQLVISGSSARLSSSVNGSEVMVLTGTVTIDGEDITISYDQDYVDDHGTYNESQGTISISGYTFNKK